jgi:hypothetical protein
MNGDEVWDEHKWEESLRERDRLSDRYMKDYSDFVGRHPVPDTEETTVRRRWEDDLDAFMASRGWEFHSRKSDTDGSGEPAAEQLLDEGDDDGFFEDGAEQTDFRELPLWQRAHEVSCRILDWANSLDVEEKDSTVVQYCFNMLQVAANVAKGHAYGYEHDLIGGNIACCKRALKAANHALDWLCEMKNSAYMTTSWYRQLYETTFELRNDVALYVVDLRDRFELGLDLG